MNGPTDPPAAPPRPPRLLLVEDEPAQWMFFLEALQPYYDVELATDGTRAWELAQLQVPDLVLADVLLPGGMDGFTLARRLRDYPPTAKVPILLLSASTKIDLLVRGLQAGAYDVMLKPVPVNRLLEVLRARLAESGEK